MGNKRDPNLLSRMLTLSEDDSERVRFESEIWLLGRYWECRYYLSVLTGCDQCALPNSQFFDNLCSFVESRTGDKANLFFKDGNDADVQFFHCVLRAAYEERRRISPHRKGNKRRRAIGMLLIQPDWSDAEIADSVETTEKQLQRDADFTALRRIQRRSHKRDNHPLHTDAFRTGEP